MVDDAIEEELITGPDWFERSTYNLLVPYKLNFVSYVRVSVWRPVMWFYVLLVKWNIQLEIVYGLDDVNDLLYCVASAFIGKMKSHYASEE